MGYYTDFHLDYRGELPKKELLTSFEKITDYSLEDYPYLTGVRWYDHLDDMVTLSKLYPKVLFTLNGNGEDTEDLFTYYFFNGEYSGGFAEIIYPSVDPSFEATVKRSIPEHFI